MAKQKTPISRKQLEDRIVEIEKYKGYIEHWLKKQKDKVKEMDAQGSTEPPNGPKNPPGTP